MSSQFCLSRQHGLKQSYARWCCLTVTPEISLSSYDEFLLCLLNLSCITSDWIQLPMGSFGHRPILSQSGVPFPSEPTSMSVVISQKMLKSRSRGDRPSAETHESLLESLQEILPQTFTWAIFPSLISAAHWGWQITWPKFRLPTESFSSHEPTPDTSCKYALFLS